MSTQNQDPKGYAMTYPAIEANIASAHDPSQAYVPPAPTGTPEWVQKLKEQKDGQPWHVRIVQMALDLFDYNDGIFWANGYEGWDEENLATTEAWRAPFWREAWVDAMPNGEYQLVTDKVCAIGSIQLFIGGGDDNADYNTIISRLNDISREFSLRDDDDSDHGSIVSRNDGIGREAVQEVMQEYVRRYGGEQGEILPDYKPLVRFDKVGQQHGNTPDDNTTDESEDDE